MWVTGSYDVDTNQVLWGTGNPVPMFNPYYRPGDNLCPSWLVGNNHWSASYSRRTKLLYIPSASSCNQSTLDPDAGRDANGVILGGAYKYTECNESDIFRPFLQ